MPSGQLSAGDGGGGTSGGDGGDGFELPGWLSALKVLVPFVSVLVAFASDPREFILEHVLTWVVDGTLSVGAYFAGVFEGIWSTLGTSLVDVFDPVFRGGDQILGGILGAIATVNGALTAVVSVAGPVAPILVTLFWAAIVLAVIYSIRIGLKAIPYVGQLV
jgi:hypothetical protein